MIATIKRLDERANWRLWPAALLPLGIIFLRFVSASFFNVPNQPAVLLALVIFTGLFGGVWVGLFAAILQLIYTLWFFNGVDVAAGAATFVHWSPSIFHLTLSEPEFERFITYLFMSPSVAIAAGWARQVNDKQRRDGIAQATFANTLFEQASVAIAYADTSGRILRCNQMFSNLVGRPPEELAGMNFKELIDPRDVEENTALAKQLFAGVVDQIVMENRYVRKNGDSIWVKKFVNLIRSTSGEPTHTLLFARDITDERAMREELVATASKYRALWDNSGNVNFLTFAPDYLIEGGNEASVRFFGARDKQHLASLKLANLSPEKQDDGELSAKKSRKLFEAALRDGTAEFDWLFRALDGREAFGTVKLTHLDDLGRDRLQVLVIDITDRVLLARHQAEERTRLAEEVNSRTVELEDAMYELHLAQSVGSMGSFAVDIAAGTFSCSPETARLFHFDKYDGIRIEDWRDKVHPDDQQYAGDAWAKAVAGAPFDITYRISVPEGVRYIRAGARFKRDSEGKAISAVGALLDVSSLMAKRERYVSRDNKSRVDGLLAATAAVQADAEQNIDTNVQRLAEQLLLQFPEWSAEDFVTVVDQAISEIRDSSRLTSTKKVSNADRQEI